MKTVQRSELLDYVTYSEQRDAIRERVMAIKAPRRIHLGDYLTFLFENADTMRYQVQEMMRAEQIVKEDSIQHELDTYNGLLGGPGELGCALLIEIPDANERVEKLRAWKGLPAQVYLKTASGAQITPTFDAAQVGEDRLSAVQYLKFAIADADDPPVALGCTLGELTGEVALTDAQRAALLEDLKS